jgi:hypothetical protein
MFAAVVRQDWGRYVAAVYITRYAIHVDWVNFLNCQSSIISNTSVV